ncbi:aspartate/glutamate racemase family protein [Streptomyces parvulus]|uniref:aspartate/glutamate racemase family protein n=1 Tax=Streptomyces parvulus TaxID=146923 RepID=UPI001E33D076|nr:aspartate/glutamate racemase family protein [Streptomyces parvulus]MCC9155368.1 aspartate/glutamate racemase family protein [Streptomyces parvulus]MCE7687622.1 aspartate/glutamate racemase family protein [Streptomyces parvulus]
MLALLHTSPVHVPVFDALRDAAHPGLELRHHVHAALLERARREGPEAVTEAVGDVLRRAVAQGARAVLCTCSTIGAVAESAAAGVPVLRVDRPMAAAAVAAGPRVVVLAALRSTLAPTAALVEEEAWRAGRPLLLRTRLVEGAWDRFEAGDTEGYLQLVAEAAEAVTADDTDVIVLAQASMAPAREAARTPVPVLASPALGLAAGAAAARLGHLDPAGSCGGVSAEAGVG